MNSILPTSTSTLLFDNGPHKCLSFSSLVKGDGVQANQFLIIHNERAAVLDPGGDLTYTPLTIEISKHIKLQNLDYVFASHQDPDIITSMPRWLMHTRCKVVASKLWARFLPHLASGFVTTQMKSDVSERLIELPDRGAEIPFGDSVITCVPAHFLHSVGNFQFYDPVSKILFSGDMGASMVDDVGPVKDFETHVSSMRSFHQRYMCSRRVTRLWAEMVRRMDVEMLVPQHGSYFVGKPMIHRFLDWIADLDCGIDLLTQEDYRCP
ncbi:MAG TPA: MBL fold metallo-hydrolase [Moraxellaceae bacterium]|nr:MBL fold metallo-hydrolase [Moraxellaceae bacterium]